MAIPFRLPTYHDPRAALVARAQQLLSDLVDTLGQLEQLQQPSDWYIQDDEEETADGQQPTLHAVNPQLLVEAVRAVAPSTHQDNFDRVVGDDDDAFSAYPTLISCHANPPHAPPAAVAARCAAPDAPNPNPAVSAVPAATTTCAAATRSAQSWHQVGNNLRRLADEISSDFRLKRVSCNSPARQSDTSRNTPSFIQSLLALVLPKKLSYSATVIYIGMRLLKFNLKDF
ncbi:uncharacterized protein LOC132199847 [Neocloeon triangulifer]|uniref:uncharacterized protein LOC132199847 n=1 Tax=Neocloeon triangulifer TaxID=2078957 RepID=UPI00286F5526|nr:uncharacterized protein LOC132199847 [Neocloeon triangulifer]